MEEMICELASFYVLPRVARSWIDVPPFRAARSYASSFSTYIDVERADAEQLPSGMHFADWMHTQESYLRHNAYDRSKNAAIALRMVPVFEARPSLWTCATYLELDISEAERDQLDSLLRGWRAKSPKSCQEDIAAFAAVLGVTLN
jgi:hypothetical protein